MAELGVGREGCFEEREETEEHLLGDSFRDGLEVSQGQLALALKNQIDELHELLLTLGSVGKVFSASAQERVLSFLPCSPTLSCLLYGNVRQDERHVVLGYAPILIEVVATAWDYRVQVKGEFHLHAELGRVYLEHVAHELSHVQIAISISVEHSEESLPDDAGSLGELSCSVECPLRRGR